MIHELLPATAAIVTHTEYDDSKILPTASCVHSRRKTKRVGQRNTKETGRYHIEKGVEARETNK